jgi:nitrate reductase gamma subunit
MEVLMPWNEVLFFIYPYFVFSLFAFGLIFRYVKHPFGISSLSSQLLERKKLLWGILSWHWAIIPILFAHLFNFIFGSKMAAFESMKIGAVAAQILGFGWGVLAIFGMVTLIYRRISVSRLWAVTTPVDVLIVLSLLLQIVLGVYTRVALYDVYHYWFVYFFDPYLVSIFKFNPQPSLITGLPWFVQLHVFNAMTLLMLLPYSRLIHILAFPIAYLFRPFQIILRGKWLPVKEQ